MSKKKIAGQPKLWIRHPVGGGFPCPGCGHGLVQRVIAEVIEELGVEGKAVAICGVGCGWLSFLTLDFDGGNCPHGRATDVATGIKRSLGDKGVVLTIQGDGDTIAIGAEGLINAAARAEKITVIMVNNTNYGTTGGQMAPTSLLGQITTTTPDGRNSSQSGYPINVAEFLTGLRGVAYSARGAFNNLKNYRATKKYLTTALEKQIKNIGFSFVEILSPCPPNWHLSPLECLDKLENELMVDFPVGEFKNLDKLE